MFRIFYFCFLTVTAFSASENGKFTVAFWGDSRGNGGQATEEIAGYLVEEKGKTIDAHIQNGDFTYDGTSSDWVRAWGIKNIKEACVKDYFYMSTSNHDIGSSYQGEMADFLPSNGSNVFYYHKSWPIPGTLRKVHLLAFDLYYKQDTDAQINYFKDKLKDASPDDWILALWHSPSFNRMTYKNEQFGQKMDFVKYVASAETGGDFVLNGHAHVFVRSHVLDAEGNRVEISDSRHHTSPDSSAGLVHIVNGRGGQFDYNENSPWENNVFQPDLGKTPDGLVTLMEFDDNTVHLNTVKIGSDYLVFDTLDTWSWTRGAPMALSSDTTAPVVTVDVLKTNKTTPGLTGTIDDPTATITIDLDGQQYTAVNNGDGTWALADNLITPLTDNIYDVKVTAVDTAGNIGNDISTNELVSAEFSVDWHSHMTPLDFDAIPVYADGNGIHIEIPIDVSFSINIIDVYGSVLESFSGSRRGERNWNNTTNVSGVFYVIVNMAGKSFFRKVMLIK
ncbi:MAG: hypothetical protein HQK83_06975 [Fibrobacteria bacterium]|nr:hypothetical protein [Fibrobacteria bacterium]